MPSNSSVAPGHKRGQSNALENNLPPPLLLTKRQSTYGLPKRYDQMSKPSDIDFSAPEILPVHQQLVKSNQQIEGLADEPSPIIDLNATSLDPATEFRSRANTTTSTPQNLSPQRQESLPVSPTEFKDFGVLFAESGGVPGVSLENPQVPGNEIYFMGIIDILTVYGVKKRFEHGFKSLVQSPDQISAVSPKKYAERFKAFLKKAIT